MESSRFDNLSRRLAHAESRRTVLKILASGLVAGILSGFSESTPKAEAATCLPGTYKHGNSCIACGIGTYSSASDSATCSPCPTGTYAANTGGAACTACTPGYYNDTVGQASCTECPANTFSATAGSNACTPCPSGETAPAGSATCTSTACPSGTLMCNGTCVETCHNGRLKSGPCECGGVCCAAGQVCSGSDNSPNGRRCMSPGNS